MRYTFRSCFWPNISTVEQFAGAGNEMQMPNAEMSAWLGISYGSATNAPSSSHHGNRVGDDLQLVGREAGQVGHVRHGNPGAPESMLIEELCVVREAFSLLEARRRRAVGGIEAGDDAKKRGRIRHGARERTCGVLVRRDRQNARAADEAERRLDADDHVCRSRTENRSGRFGADRDGHEIRRDRDSRS